MAKELIQPTIPPGDAVIILNPTAGDANVDEKHAFVKRAADRLHAYGWNVDIAETVSAGHEAELAAEAVAQHANVIFAAGGDGTSEHMYEVIEGTETALGVLPEGTINLWARQAGIPKNTEDAIDVQLGSDVRQMDIGVFNERFHFRSVAGFGLDGKVIFDIDDVRTEDGERKIKGYKAYTALAARTYRSIPSTEARIHIDGETY